MKSTSAALVTQASGFHATQKFCLRMHRRSFLQRHFLDSEDRSLKLPLPAMLTKLRISRLLASAIQLYPPWLRTTLTFAHTQSLSFAVRFSDWSAAAGLRIATRFR